MTMIALGGVIGAGLFVGSGVVIKAAGPAAVVSFVITGLLVLLVMRMLGEMAAALPAVGSFYEYARLAWSDRPQVGELAGFLTGWMYWYFWVIVVAMEAVAGAGLIRLWLPNEPTWSISLALLLSADPDQSGLGEVIWRIRVLARLDQGRRDRRLLDARGRLRAGAVARRCGQRCQPHGSRRLRSERHTPHHDRCRRGHGLLLWSRAGHDRGGGGGRACEGHCQDDKLGHHARAVLLRGFDPAGRVPGAVEFGRNQHALRQRPQCDGHTRRGADHERGGAHRGTVSAEFGACMRRRACYSL